jgi:CHAT domain-containing protein/Tfp pilus assembly protein PilF
MGLAAHLPPEESWIEQIIDLPSQSARQDFLRHNLHLLNGAVVQRLYDEVVRLARVDLTRAAIISETLSWITDHLSDQGNRAVSLRAEGHIFYLTGKYRQAQKCYERALKIFKRLHRDVDVGRTCISALQTWIYLGQYEKAMSWARLAGDRLRLARLDTNIGNILYRQDRFEEALSLYRRAHQEFRNIGDSQDVGITLRNIAVCYISLNEFSLALELYDEARHYCREHNMPLLVAECDYNIAYLYYLRGQYTPAIRLYEVAREHCERVGDQYHKALCDLDLSEMYVELNLIDSATDLAIRAHSTFSSLGMRYEAAKALTNLAVADSNRANYDSALQLLRRARKLFSDEKNQVWFAISDFLEAVVLYRSGNLQDSQTLCQSALDFFRSFTLPSKVALCELLLARLDLENGDPSKAKHTCARALRRLRTTETPALDYHAWFLLGEINEKLGGLVSAQRSYKRAREKLEHLRTQLRAEEPKISFLQDKMVVYENLVRICLRKPNRKRKEEAFSYIEQAKSRSLADLISFRAYALSGSSPASSESMQRIQKLRSELNSMYKRMELNRTESSSVRSRLRVLRTSARHLEDQLAKALSELSVVDEEYANLQSAKTISLEQIRSVMPADTLILEYFAAGGTMYAAVLGREMLDVVPLAPVAQIFQHVELLQLQLSKFRLGAEYLNTFATLLRAATAEHLRALYVDLVAPLRPKLNCEHLVIAPHDFLHLLPFHALIDEKGYLIDQFAISYVPSASVYYLCNSKKPRHGESSLVMGIPDSLTPHILDEVQEVSATLPNTRLLIGQEATVEQLRKYGPTSRFVHIATHGLFRKDNPIFSSIRLGDSQLCLYDLYDLRLNSELVTLSGCGTGLNVVMSGDELLGLVRGLLYSGTDAALVTLWDVNDQSTADFMKHLYKVVLTTTNKSRAMQSSLQKVREKYPDVYHWAPFVLIGKS